jgi:hypothetical protein
MLSQVRTKGLLLFFSANVIERTTVATSSLVPWYDMITVIRLWTLFDTQRQDPTNNVALRVNHAFTASEGDFRC